MVFLTVLIPVGIVSFVSFDVADQSQLFCRNSNYVTAKGLPVKSIPELFPKDFGRSVCNPRPELSQAENYKIKDSLSLHTKEWYSEHLVAACEPTLFHGEQTPIATNGTVIRFLWLRSFDPTVTVRIHIKNDGTSSLIAKELSGPGGYSAGQMAKRIERKLTTIEQQKIHQFLRRTRIFENDAIECGCCGFDGAQWVFEKSDVEGYDYLERWSPSSGDVHDFGILMLELTGWHFDEIY